MTLQELSVVTPSVAVKIIVRNDVTGEWCLKYKKHSNMDYAVGVIQTYGKWYVHLMIIGEPAWLCVYLTKEKNNGRKN